MKPIDEYKNLRRDNENMFLGIQEREEEIEKLQSLNRELVREIEIDRKILNKLECTCNEDNDFICKRCSRILELNALLKGIYLERVKGVE